MERDKSVNGSQPTAFSTHAKRRNDVGPSHSKRQGFGSKKGFKGKGKGRCFNCNKFGHYATEFPHKKNPPRDNNNNQRNNRSNYKGKWNSSAAQEGNN